MISTPPPLAQTSSKGSGQIFDFRFADKQESEKPEIKIVRIGGNRKSNTDS